MPTDETLTQGTQTGEPGTVADASGGVSTEAAAPATDPLAGVDWDNYDLEKLPKSFIAKVERTKAGHLDADYTRKTQALAQERERLLDKALQFGGREAPAPDEKAQLLDRLKNGDLDVIDQYVSREVASRLGPLEAQMTRERAIQEAKQMHPYVGSREPEVAQLIASDPGLRKMALSGDPDAMKLALVGAAIAIHDRETTSEYEKLKTSFDAKVKEEVASLSKAAKSLPPQTSKAGSTPSASSSAATMGDFKAAALRAADQLGVSVDPWFRELAGRKSK